MRQTELHLTEEARSLVDGIRTKGLHHTREVKKQDYEYVRNGTTNLFVAVEPKGGRRVVSVTKPRCKTDFVVFVDELLTGAYAKARRIHLVLDNLNTHFRKCFDDVLGRRAATNFCAAWSFTTHQNTRVG